MSVLIEKLSSEIFEILKSYGKTLILYDSSGNITYSPEEASRIYIQPEKMMLSISNDGDDNEVKLYLSNSIILSDVMKLINTIRQLCTRLNTLFNVRKYGKELSPKDFAYQVAAGDLHESYWGSTRTSYSNIGDCKLIYHHNKNVNEELKGSRSRHIKNIYIENKNKEKILFPTNNINAARALARHLSSGGLLYDKVGDYIVESAKEYAILKNALCAIKKLPLSENTSDIISSIKNRLFDINKTFDVVRGSRNYKKYKDLFANKSLYEFSNYDNNIEDNISKLYINEPNISEAIPYIVTCMSGNKSLLPYITVNDYDNIIAVSQYIKRKFKYGIDYTISNETISFYNPDCFSEFLSFFEENNINFEINANEISSNDDKKIVVMIQTDDIHTVLSIINMELGLEPNIDYVVNENKIGFYSGNSFAEVNNLLNISNTNFIKINEDNFDNTNEEDCNTMSENQNDKIYQFAVKWLSDNTDSSAKLSPEDTSQDRTAISGKAESLANDLRKYMSPSTTSIDGIDKVEGRKFASSRAEQAYKISSVAEASGLTEDMLFNFLTTIAEKIRNNMSLDTNEKSVALKTIKIFDSAKNTSDASEVETSQDNAEQVTEDDNNSPYRNIISITWSQVSPRFIDRIRDTPYGQFVTSQGDAKNGYMNFEVPQEKVEMFKKSVLRSAELYGNENNISFSVPTEIKKPYGNLGRWKDAMGFKEEIELDEWFDKFNPDMINEINIDPSLEQDSEEFNTCSLENSDELEEPEEVETVVVETIFDPKDESKLAQDIEYVKNGGELNFVYVDDGGKYTIYEENTNTPIKSFNDSDVADKICNSYNGRKYDQAKDMVINELQSSLSNLRSDKEEAELNEQEISLLARNRKLNEYAITQYSPSYEVDVNRSFGVERYVSISEEFNMITSISEDLFRVASKNRIFEGISFDPSIFEESAIDIFEKEIKPRLIECGFTFDEQNPEELEVVVVSPDTCNFDDIQAALYGNEYPEVEEDLEFGKVGDHEIDLKDPADDEVDYIKSLSSEEKDALLKKLMSDMHGAVENPIHEDEGDNESPIDIARRMGYDAARTGDHDKYDASLRSLMNDHVGDEQREDIHKAYIEGMDSFKDGTLEEKDLGKPGKNFDKIAKSAGKEYGSEEAGKKVAGAVLAKLRKEHPEEYKESSTPSISNIRNMLDEVFTNEDDASDIEGDETIPTNVQATTRNDVSSDIVDNPDQDMLNDLRRRAGLK